MAVSIFPNRYPSSLNSSPLPPTSHHFTTFHQMTSLPYLRLFALILSLTGSPIYPSRNLTNCTIRTDPNCYRWHNRRGEVCYFWLLWFLITSIYVEVHRMNDVVPSVLWHCWLGSRKGIRPVKNWVVGCWRGYLSGAMCRFAYGPADATATHCLLLQ